MEDIETVFCVLCLNNEATVHSGHVRKGNKIILAGWCDACKDSPKAQGFVGHYRVEMGERDAT